MRKNVVQNAAKKVFAARKKPVVVALKSAAAKFLLKMEVASLIDATQ